MTWEYLTAHLRLDYDNHCTVVVGEDTCALADVGKAGWELVSSGPWGAWLEKTSADLPPGVVWALPNHIGVQTYAIFKRRGIRD